MFRQILLLAAIAISSPAAAQSKISVDAADSHIGDSVTVCAKVYGVKSLDKVTFINLGAAYPASPLTVVIFSKDLAGFSKSPADLYNNREICVTGTIKEYKGKPEIVVSSEAAIKAQ